MKHPLLFAAAIVGLAACDLGTETRKDVVPQAQAPTPTSGPALPAGQSAPTPAPLIAAGPAVTVGVSTDDGAQYAASVIRLDPLTKQGEATVKLLGTGGGDPAMNGLYTDIAFFTSPADGWVVFRIGDFLDYAVLSETPGRVDLKVTESVMDETNGQISSRERHLIVRWTPGSDGAPPAAVTVIPAR